MHQNISQKYRPQTFQDVVGQDAIVTTLKNAILLKKVAPAYLFCGCRGTGKTTLARLFAKALNCNNLNSEAEPCNSCPSCIKIAQGAALDVIEIDGASNRGIDDIRQINETIYYATATSAYKIYIIDEVHMLTKEAFNALLKTLEEPPQNVKFFFATTEPQKIIPTIISRCQRFDLHRLTIKQIEEKLKKITTDLQIDIEQEVFLLIATLAEGGLRDAESLLDQLLCYNPKAVLTYAEVTTMLGISPKSFYFLLDNAIKDFNLSFAFDLSAQIFSSGKDLGLFFDGLFEHYRTILSLKLNLPLPTNLNEQERARYIESVKIYTEDHCLYILDYLIEWHKEIVKTTFKRITLEMILLHLIRSKKRISLTQLVQRLETLEKTETLEPIENKTTTLSQETATTPPQEIEILEKKTLNQGPPKEIFPANPPLPFTKPPESFQESRNTTKIRLETILRFAAVELEGLIKKD
jgi:DNA polymerase III subunit gamma/tau